MKTILCSILLLFYSVLACGNNAQQPMPVEEAFSVSASLFGEDTVLLHWQIAPRHYLYQERFHFSVITPQTARIGQILYPPGLPKHDEVFGHYQVYTDTLTLPIPIIQPDPEHTVIDVSYQGCAEDGYCYPPTTHRFNVNFKTGVIQDVTPPPPTEAPAPATQTKSFTDLFDDHNVFTLMLFFLGAGALLSFTPCVLPMIPILSGIIVGHQKTVLAGKAFRLSLVYVLSMALTYAVAGMLVGWLGGSVQAFFQTPAVLIGFSLLFVLLALSFFGLYSLKLPTRFEEWIATVSRHQKSGHYLGVAAMGCLATLIVSPCVTPALVGVLGYISQTGNALIGGAALFSLGLGMGLPLLVIGATGGKLLPKAGSWMTTVEYIFGVLFLGIAIWMLERLLPPSVTLLLWGMLLIGCAVYMGALSGTPAPGWGKLWKGLGFVLLIYGVLLLIGAAQGNGDPLRPLSQQPQLNVESSPAQSLTTTTLPEVEAALAQAAENHKPVLLEFYADWCVSCRIMERTTFKDTRVQTALAGFQVIRVDVTQNNAATKTLLHRFHVIAPPTFLLFNTVGAPLPALTRVGEMDAEGFLAYLESAPNLPRSSENLPTTASN